MKTIIARFTELKENVSASDSEFDDLDYNKVDKALKSVGINLKDANGQFRNLDDVFLELSEEWSTLDRNTQRYIATIAAGSRQQSRFIAMMEDYGRTMELVETAQDSAGRSEEQFAKYADTLQNKVNALKNTWEQLRVGLMDSDFFKNIVDSANNALQKIGKMDFKVLLPTAVSLVPIFKTYISAFTNSLKSSGNSVITISNNIGKLAANAISTAMAKGFNSDSKLSGFLGGMSRAEKKLEILKKKYELLMNDNTRQVPATEIAKLEAEIRKAEAELSNIEGRLPGRINNLMNSIGSSITTIAQTAAMSIGMLISGGSLEDSLKSFSALVLTQATTVAMELLAKTVASWTTRLLAEKTGQTASLAQQVASDRAIEAEAAAHQQRMAAISSEGALASAGGAVAGGAAAGAGGAAGAAGGAAAMGPVGIALLVIVGLAALYITHLIKQQKEAEKLRKIESQRPKYYKEMAEKQSSHSKELAEAAKDSKEHLDTLKEQKKTLDDLNSKDMLTTAEKQKQSEIVEKLKNDYPGLITKYDEQNNKVEYQKQLWEEILEDQEKIAKIDAEKSAMGKIAQNYFTKNSDYYGNKKKIEQGNLNYSGGGTFDYYNGQYYFSNELVDIRNATQAENIWGTLFGAAESDKDKRKGKISDYIRDTFGDIYVTEDELDKINELVGHNGFTTTYETDAEYQKIFNTFVDRAHEAATATEELSESFLDAKDAALMLGSHNEYSSTVNELRGAVAQTIDIENLQGAITTGSRFDYMDQSILDSLAFDYGDAESVSDLEEKDRDAFVKSYNDLLLLRAQIAEYERQTAEEDKSTIEKQNRVIDEFESKKNGLTRNEIFNYDVTDLQGDQDLLVQFNKRRSQMQKEITDSINGFNARFGSNLLAADWSKSMVDGLNKSLDSVVERYGEDTAQDYFSTIMSKFGDLDAPILNTLFAVKWEDLDLTNFEDIKKKTIEDLKEYMGGEEAEKAWEDFYNINSAYDVSSIAPQSVEAAEEVADKINAKIAETIGATNKISSIIKNQLEDGVISFSDSNTLEKELSEIGLKASDYLLGTTDKGYLLNTDKLKEDLLNQVDGNEELINLAKEQIKLQIDKIDEELLYCDAQMASIERAGVALDMINKQIEAQQQLNRETYGNSYVPVSRTIFANMSKDDLISKRAELQAQKENLQGVLLTLEEEGKVAKRTANDIKAGEAEINKAFESNKTAADELEKANKNLADAMDKVRKAEEKLVEAQKELDEAINGSPFYSGALDALYNYNTNIERLVYNARKAKEAFEDLSKTVDSKQSLSDYLSNTHAEIVNREALIRKYQEGAQEKEQALLSGWNQKIAEINAQNGVNMDQVQKAFTMVNGRMNVNYDAINNAHLNDKMKDALYKDIEARNKYMDEIDKQKDEIEKKEKEINEVRKKARDEFIKLQDKVIEVLKKKHEEEIKDNEDKNKALEEADNKYLESLKKNIDKQRKLREQEDAWEDLAEKQKRLSLMERDTSGANKKEVKKLQKDVKKTQQQLLDKSVDQIVDSLKELYELQKETRETEIEYQKAMVDNAALVVEANNLIDSWGDDTGKMIEWMFENNKDLSEKTQEQIDKEMESWTEMFEAKNRYLETTVADFENVLVVQESEIAEVVNTTSSNLIEESRRAMNGVSDEVSKLISTAQNGVQEAIKGLNEARNTLNTAAQAQAEAAQKALDETNRLQQMQAQQAQQQAQQQQQQNMNNAINQTAEVKNSQLKMVTDFDSRIPSGTGQDDAIRERKLMDYAKLSERITDNDARNFYKKQLKEKVLKDLSIHEGTIDQKTYELLERFNKQVQSWGKISITHNNTSPGGVLKFAKGGMVNYTGPAWVDGTPSRPEAFLSAEDTERIGNAAKLLANIPLLNTNTGTPMSSNVGDTSIEIHINVDSLGSDYDVDRLAERVKQDIVSAARPTGTPIILRKAY